MKAGAEIFFSFFLSHLSVTILKFNVKKMFARLMEYDIPIHGYNLFGELFRKLLLARRAIWVTHYLIIYQLVPRGSGIIASTNFPPFIVPIRSRESRVFLFGKEYVCQGFPTGIVASIL